MKRKIISILQFFSGAILIILSLTVFNTRQYDILSGLSLGFGSSFVILGIGFFIRSFMVSEAEEKSIQKQERIELQDERNATILQKSSHMTGKVMTILQILFLYALSILDADKLLIILAGGLLITKFCLMVGFSNYYSKKI